MTHTPTLPSGLSIQSLRRSPEGFQLRLGDRVGVFYAGRLSDGTPFDANFDFNGFLALRQPFVFTLGEGEVIEGWEEGLAGRRIGEVLELTIPPELGYGSQGQGSIPANATLIFTVVLLGVIPAEQAGLPAEQIAPIFYDLKALGLTPRRLGLNRKLLSADLSTAESGRLLVGTDLNDTLTGRSEGELLLGLRGLDRLTGGGGADIQVGGTGADTFVIAALNDSLPGRERRDRIADFKGGKGDRIDLSGGDADSGREGVQPFRFIGAAAFSGQAGDLRYKAGLLQGDVDGDRLPDLEIALLGKPNLQASHLVLEAPIA